jgi:hypothetical protein
MTALKSLLGDIRDMLNLKSRNEELNSAALRQRPWNARLRALCRPMLNKMRRAFGLHEEEQKLVQLREVLSALQWLVSSRSQIRDDMEFIQDWTDLCDEFGYLGADGNLVSVRRMLEEVEREFFAALMAGRWSTKRMCKTV